MQLFKDKIHFIKLKIKQIRRVFMKKIEVLDKGYVILHDVMGTDLIIERCLNRPLNM